MPPGDKGPFAGPSCRSWRLRQGIPLMQETMSVADEVWIAVASLHRDRPEQEDFTINEIMEQAEAANLTGHGTVQPSVRAHICLHCGANKPSNPERYRMLFETLAGRPRLFRPGDSCLPRRAAGKYMPKRHEIPVCHGELLDWFVAEYVPLTSADTVDPLLALRGLGKGLWAGETADDHVRRQRSGW